MTQVSRGTLHLVRNAGVGCTPPVLTMHRHAAARAKRVARIKSLRRALAPADVRARDEVYYGRFLNGVMILVKRNGRNTINLW